MNVMYCSKTHLPERKCHTRIQEGTPPPLNHIPGWQGSPYPSPEKMLDFWWDLKRPYRIPNRLNLFIVFLKLICKDNISHITVS
ncbi:hypothetical protein SLEP1_g23030 [Rubroshorea leprosula]|uniref:Uncharacterized protein n=1 Tax=Rubroshorea leprosula TaxID=152421 RepID=A0AAV5JIC1_9ROSI|nr:hypothetical protein SLEP1_g23030 [Rubroshorea leprosula]